MRAQRRVHKSRSWVWRIVVIAFVAFLFVKGVQLHVQLREKEQLLAEKNEAITKQMLINEDLEEQKAHAGTDEYMERYANEAGWMLPGQQIYQSSAG